MALYIDSNPKTKKLLKELVAKGPVDCHQPGPFGGKPLPDGIHCAEGPHFPKPHRWYAEVALTGNQVVRVIS